MSDRLNPVILVQLMMRYHNDHGNGSRVFKFTKNNRMRIHNETGEEAAKRKSVLSDDIRNLAEGTVRDLLKKTLHGRIREKVWIDPEMKKIAVPIQSASSQGGFDILPTGSRVKIPEGKKIRAFTYWEKVNDIDLSCFGLTEDGQQKEFSWRSMYSQQSDAITFSGDETSGYNGGSEYFDIDIDAVRKRYPDFLYLVFCNNIYSDWGRTHFKDCFCKAGFMNRDILDSGEVYEPKTVQTSFRITADSSFGYLFALDLETREMVWLNLNRSGDHSIAGTTEMKWVMDFLEVTDVFSVYDLYAWAAGEENLADNVYEATIVVHNNAGLLTTKDQTVVRSWDIEKMLALLQ